MNQRVVCGIVLLLAQAARGQGKVSVDPAEVDEGRPMSLRVTWENAGPHPCGLLALEAGDAAHAPPGERQALWLDPLADEAVTVEVEASERLGAEARAPRPPVTGRLAGEPCLLLRQVDPGTQVTLEVRVLPGGEALELPVRVRVVALPPPGPLGGPTLYAPARVQQWLPDLEGARPGDRGVSLALRLVRWRPQGEARTAEVLVRKDTLQALEAVEERSVLRVKVRPADFGRAAAAARAGLRPTADGVRLADGRWLLQAGERAAIVPAEGEVTAFQGQLLPWATELARTTRAALRWYEAHEHPELAEALRRGGFVRGEGKGFDLEVNPGNLVAFVGILEQHGATLRDGRLVKR